ncbi:MAG TPA: CotH kinase family protein, partial [Verrucomicrobiales bacterium]|nr:CotH kinase family protein [Verrucomicrobiales bacterium]
MIKAMRCLFAAAWTFVFMTKAGAAVVLSEIVAANKTGITDENGAHTDWIELHNDGSQPVDLHHWHLTDDPLRLTRWEFPAVVIPAGGYLVLFASGKDRSDPGSLLHTDFSLSAEGEYLALTNAAGQVVDEIAPAFPPQVADVSWGRIAGGAPGFAYFYTPTPGSGNLASSRASDPPVISVGGRTFTNAFTVAVSSPQQDAQIFYTTDGSLPTTASTAYAGPVTISTTTRLRAVAVAPGMAMSLVRGAVYLQLAPNAVPLDSNLPLMIIDNFNGGTPQPDISMDAAWMVFEPGGGNGRTTLTSAPVVSTAASIKVRGSSTAMANKFSLSVEARNETGGDRDFFLLGLPADSDWILTAPYEYDRSLIRNPLMYDLSRQAGRYAPRTRQVELYINTDGGAVSAADYFGVYTLTEKIKRSADRIDVTELNPLDNSGAAVTGGYLLKIDRADPGETGITAGGQTLFFVDPDEPKITASQKAWLTSYLNSFRSALGASDFFDPVTGYAKWIDPSTFIDHHILNVAAKNVDALRLSAYLFKDRLGRLSAGPLWDFDRSLESVDARDNNFNTWRGETGDLGTDFFRYTWYADLFRDENFWQHWIDRYDEMRRGPLSNARVLAAVDAQAAELAEAAARNFVRWSDKPPRFGGWSGEVANLRSWFTSRLDWMDSQFTRPPVANTAGGPVPSGFQVNLTSPSLSKPGAVIYYTTDGSDPRIFDVTTGQQIISETFIPLDHPVKVILPTQDIGTVWRDGSAFDDSAWWSGIQGVGFDDTTAYDPYIGFNLESPPPERRMKGVIQSCYLRFHFSVTPERIAPLTFLKLRVRCDDGMVAWLNGTKLPASIKEPATLLWNSGATSNTVDSTAVLFTEFTIPNPQALLRSGDNVLAIHGLNYLLTSTDFLIQLELL